MDNDGNKKNVQTNRVDINNLPANATGKQIKEYQEQNRNKYQTQYNIYHDKTKTNQDSNIIMLIIGIIILIIILIILISKI